MTEPPDPHQNAARPRLPEEYEQRLTDLDRRVAEVYTQLERAAEALDEEEDG